ncbi:hypothetical protein [Flavilitoribacter nigricans]|uniref:Class I SAM-dependent methyltransferase n=1 Tax=Flavilitoribacter nigricans (strain ATCC 23147 / DSM 23189 / NBRC 102662 / NCIMB 1420 / SS-2) TaxID=1122177 RepID=A0A2D0N291_FLAN2|nr:hypothetical protein [Flavilitoribacter nigricans]PHN02506.1 hypothetical protein CRP01_31510 [Flavilitoribacter nigricans DSM 23189 = NBRC 102662]
MARWHLFEIEDQPWFPTFLRNYLTDFLQFLSNKTGLYSPLVSIIEKGLNTVERNRIIDLGSGGGGGLIHLNAELKARIPDLEIVLTDYYPNIPAFEFTAQQADNFRYISESVDARQVPADLTGLRTMFLALHHFRPEDAAQILQNAVDSGYPIAVFEAQERSVPSILAMVFSPLTVLFTTPFIRPFKIGRIVFTYLIPIIPLVVLWDGIVSALRTYSVPEMNALVAQLDRTEDYNWDIGRIRSGPGQVLYLLGTKQSLKRSRCINF